MGIVDCSADIQANGRKYTVRAATMPKGGEDSQRVEIALTDRDPAGVATECGSFTLPTDNLAAVGKLINQVLSGLSTLSGRSAATPANASAPWTKEQDDELLDRWASAGDTHSATALRRILAEHFGRTTGSIRARLLRIGCDPDVPGHAFVPVPGSS
ncbi:hypothetical protein [Kibdelosporangium phytohabitans]|uniref:Uncharacterized protein n=1 Tax=Kibdelosporangium phytohabitans TaxID=860235 RepID=A0A0N9HJD6_9PSEU|nr:hypothetical protein [Kibdelosporangium phytohabitans]ALG06142.1 hypothetical protein AOZ06_03685 [Kibdelosporangium phytohabitans]MBE1465767.1 hypothetical protein [Kibdelosporangium phytohabitans]